MASDTEVDSLAFEGSAALALGLFLSILLPSETLSSHKNVNGILAYGKPERGCIYLPERSRRALILFHSKDMQSNLTHNLLLQNLSIPCRLQGDDEMILEGTAPLGNSFRTLQELAS